MRAMPRQPRHAGHAGCGSFKVSTYKEHETKYHGAVNCVWNVGRNYVNHMAATEIIMHLQSCVNGSTSTPGGRGSSG
jgi:hypothetical protein